VLSDLKPTIEAVEARVTYDVLPKIWGNPTRLTQLFHNLINNALKFHGDKPPKVHISAEYHHPDWLFRVEDDGVGIAAEFHERVFDVFTRLPGVTQPGSGVGLSICKRVVESHGGRISVMSEPGKGATFCFSLPARSAMATAKDGRVAASSDNGPLR
jgi:signal transduction histidine kinase